jgi:hypothetical protein
VAENRTMTGQMLGPIQAYFSDERKADLVRFATYLVFVALCLLGGGGSRGDILSLLYVRPGAILCLALILLVPGRIEFAAIRWPLILLGAWTAWLIVQLIPLPPEWWTGLPGRRLIVEGAGVLGVAQPWRPISMAPDLTLNSLAAMVVPFTALIGFAALSEDRRRQLLPVLLGAALVSVLFAIAQISSGAGSAFYLYRITNEGTAVGLFSNRNHQAALLAVAFPMLGLWAAHAHGDRRAWQLRTFSALSFAVLLVPMILVTGSRAGLLLGALAAAWCFIQYRAERAAETGGRVFSLRYLALGLASIVGLGGLFAFLAFSRAEALQRLISNGEVELRYENLPVFAQMARDMFPFGSGIGSFDPVYRIYEPDAFLSPRYLNQAHNDLMDVAITAGLPGLILLGLFVLWFLWTAFAVFRKWRQQSRTIAYGRLGAVMILLLLLASLVDYPLRVPIIAMTFAIACGWLGAAKAKLRSG